tara:strand:+ start:1117 stop:1497 length:381 start_codon:yes stop_codon:yes gene_type:complete
VFKSSLWFSFYPSLIWVLIILVGSLLPSSNVQDIEISDKLVHFVFYAVFSFFLFLLSHNVILGLDTLIKKWIFVFTIGTLVGLSIECVQYTLIPSRSGEWLDILANSIGLITTLSSTYLLKRISVL